MYRTISSLLLILASSLFSAAEVKPNSLFADGAVLQSGMDVPVWGTAHDGEQVTVAFAGQRVTATATHGRWMVRLKAMQPSAAPQTMTITGDNRIEIANVLVGEVWIASGQSNMERMLGLAEGQKPIDNWEAEVAAANYPLIRQFHVRNRVTTEPTGEAEGSWMVCSSETAPQFSAVGFFFARDLYKALNVPVGILFTAWGGTEAEAWTSADSLTQIPGQQISVDLVRFASENPAEALRQYAREAERWYRNYDAGSQGAIWSMPALDTSAWKAMQLPSLWEKAGLPSFDGVVWLRREVELPESWAGKEVVLHLGPIDDNDTTWINGVQVGATQSWNAPRDYKVPAGILKAGRNVIAVRVLDTGGGGGIYGRPDALRIDGPAGVSPASIPLSGAWLYRIGGSLDVAPVFPGKPDPDNPHQATVLFNGMVSPLVPYAIRGVIWYQGEANSGHGKQYRELFPLLISDWRMHWGEGDFPFLFVQIAPHIDMTPEVREAQFLTLSKSPATAMAVITDAGDADDIHPSHKPVVGARLALAAQALAYGKKIEYSGPLFSSVKFRESDAVLEFTHTGSGLVAQGGELRGFTIAGADKNFVAAKAEIKGRTVVVHSDQVAAPIAVRYGWANVPDVNLFNHEGLPASPFRTDVD
ncbi:MAG TPA: sialate O-acetylesterase [Terriglobales bacterium]|nr:sialate O-acetylesterase [Terriglobales bacterium]